LFSKRFCGRQYILLGIIVILMTLTGILDCSGENGSKEMEELRSKDTLAKVMNITEGKLEGLKSVVDELKLDIKRLKRELRHLSKTNNGGCYDETVKRRRREGRTWTPKKCTTCQCRVRITKNYRFFFFFLKNKPSISVIIWSGENVLSLIKCGVIK